jgi:hypothetical protein
LKAGGRIHDGPAVRDSKTGYYSAAVMDIDGNAVECVYRNSGDSASVAPSRASVQPRSIVDARSDYFKLEAPKSQVARSEAPRSVALTEAPRTEIVVPEQSKSSPFRTIVSKITTTVTSTSTTPPSTTTSDTSKALMGTLLGAAAGAAIAYAMVRSESSEGPKTPEVRRSQTVYQTIEAPPTPRSEAGSVHSTRSRRYSVSSASATEAARDMYIRMIDGPPTPGSVYEYDNESEVSQRTIRAIEAPPAAPSIVSSHKTPVITRAASQAPSHVSSHKSRYSRAPSEISRGPPPPSAQTVYSVDIEPARSTTSRASRTSTKSRSRSVAPSKAPSTVYRAPSEHSVAKSTYTVKTSSKAPSKVSVVSHHKSEAPPVPGSSKSSHVSKDSITPVYPAAYPLPVSTKTSVASYKSAHSQAAEDRHLPPSEKASFASFVSRRPSPTRSAASASTIRPARPLAPTRAATDIDDMESLAPSDSISQVSSTRSRKKKHHHRREGGSKVMSSASAFGLGGH